MRQKKSTGQSDREPLFGLTRPRSTAASTAGCTPPQPSILAARGRRFPATSSHLWRHSASPPGSPFSSILSFVLVGRQDDRVDEPSDRLSGLHARVRLLEGLS